MTDTLFADLVLLYTRKEFDPSQPRDEAGKWTGSGGGEAGGSGDGGGNEGGDSHSVEYSKDATGRSVATYHGEVDLSGDKVPDHFRDSLKKASAANVGYFFYTPKGGVESAILPSKQTPKWYDTATPRDINRITVR